MVGYSIKKLRLLSVMPKAKTRPSEFYKFKAKFEYPVILDNTVKMKILFTNVELSQFKTLKDLILSLENVGN